MVHGPSVSLRADLGKRGDGGHKRNSQPEGRLQLRTPGAITHHRCIKKSKSKGNYARKSQTICFGPSVPSPLTSASGPQAKR